MKRNLSVTVIVLLLLLLFLSRPLTNISAEPADMFIIQNADGTNTISMTGSSALTDLIQTTEPRFILQYANGKNIFPFNAPPANLVTLLQSAEDRFVVQYAKGKNVFSLTNPPSGLVALMQSSEDRFVIQYANARGTYSLSYPAELVHDTAAPVIVDIAPNQSGDDMRMVVETNEFTLARLEYGTASNTYTHTLMDDEYRYEHIFTISSLQSEIPYYYRITVTDRSGNSYQSPEYSFELVEEINVYLPVVIK